EILPKLARQRFAIRCAVIKVGAEYRSVGINSQFHFGSRVSETAAGVSAYFAVQLRRGRGGGAVALWKFIQQKPHPCPKTF
ncbi:MAG TPA: hypothetical protein VF492_10305, partial [Verrucomicrobiae bacterium]